jgi:hypothetical protein
MKNITINFKEATVFVNIYRDNVVDYNITLNNLNIHAVIVVDENGELTDNIRFYSYNYYCVFPNEDEYEIELSENYKNFVLDMAKHFHHRVDDEEFSMLGYTRDVINEKTTKRFVARTINLKYFEEV